MNFNERIKSTRKDHDETQQQIADILQMTQQQYQLYESGKRQFPTDMLRIFCLHYKVSADYLLGLPKDLNWPR